MNVQASVEANYVDGRPRHHLPSAQDIAPQEFGSIFFIVSHDAFIKMAAQDIQHIARDRHILIQNVPQPQYEWGRQSLALAGSLIQPRDVQRMFILVASTQVAHASCLQLVNYEKKVMIITFSQLLPLKTCTAHVKRGSRSV
jgi:hypothetical protein